MANPTTVRLSDRYSQSGATAITVALGEACLLDRQVIRSSVAIALGRCPCHDYQQDARAHYLEGRWCLAQDD